MCCHHQESCYQRPHASELKSSREEKNVAWLAEIDRVEQGKHGLAQNMTRWLSQSRQFADVQDAYALPIVQRRSDNCPPRALCPER
jgi:hypothetical protein